MKALTHSAEAQCVNPCANHRSRQSQHLWCNRRLRWRAKR
jgi:hypothetical protein